MDAVGKEVALQDENMKITNTLRYCSSHLKDCPYFDVKHSPEQIQNIINLALATSTSKKQTDADDNKNEDTSSEADWDVVINEWEELLTEEEFEEQDDFDNVDTDFLNSEIHPAENQAAKWKLQNLFLPNLPFPFENI
ncbi:13704_t:CDS:2 [Racocetra fulgida]|uniref:13704_t:CDS:1 n=1 Tax=Racocetra fulgida TaxID=60492 RepID=A0A9N9GAY2_9GLOM|nr:13704_t:CDS:2 [Racocetra fulgida]